MSPSEIRNGMKSHPEKPEQFDSELVAELLDQSEYPSNIGKVTALSGQWICFLKRDWHELIHYRLECVEMRYCHAIEYHKETAYYRIFAGGRLFCRRTVALIHASVRSGYSHYPKCAHDHRDDLTRCHRNSFHHQHAPTCCSF